MDAVRILQAILYAFVMKAGLTPSVMLMSMNVVYHHPTVKMAGRAATQRAASTAPVHLGFQALLVVRTSETHVPVVRVEMELVFVSPQQPIHASVQWDSLEQHAQQLVSYSTTACIYESTYLILYCIRVCVLVYCTMFKVQ